MLQSQHFLMILMTVCSLNAYYGNTELGPNQISTKVDKKKLLLEWPPVDGADGYFIYVTVSNSLYPVENDEPFTISERTNSCRIDMKRFINKPATNYNISIQSFVISKPNSYDVSPYNNIMYKTPPIAPMIQIINETCDISCFVSMRVINIQIDNSFLHVFLMNETTTSIQYYEKVAALINSEYNSSNFGYFMNPQNISSQNLTMETTKTFDVPTVCLLKIIIIAVNDFNGEIKYDLYEPKFNVNCMDVERPKEDTNTITWHPKQKSTLVSSIFLVSLLGIIIIGVIVWFCCFKRNSVKNNFVATVSEFINSYKDPRELKLASASRKPLEIF